MPDWSQVPLTGVRRLAARGRGAAGKTPMDRTDSVAARLTRGHVPRPRSGQEPAAPIRPLPRGQRLTPASSPAMASSSVLAVVPGTFVPESDR